MQLSESASRQWYDCPSMLASGRVARHFVEALELIGPCRHGSLTNKGYMRTDRQRLIVIPLADESATCLNATFCRRTVSARDRARPH